MTHLTNATAARATATVRTLPRWLAAPLRQIGTLRARWWAADLHRPAWQQWCWTLLLAALLLGTAYKLQAFDWTTAYPVPLADGSTWQLPNTYASIDHPFHIAKERATVEALRAGHLPAWFANHQAGFPAEFYPTGGDLVVALAYFLLLQQVHIAIVHKLVLIGVFFLPPLAYWAIARREQLPLSVAVLATVLHLFVRGNWLAGGSRELFDYGLWPDVFASYLPLFVILWGADWLRRGSRWGLALAALLAALAIYANPRATIGLAAALLAIGIVALAELLARPRAPHDQQAGWWRRAMRWPLLVLAGRAALLTTLIGLLSAALLLPLRDNQDRYQFTIYFHFEQISQVWSDPDHGNGIGYSESVLPQLIALAMAGLLIALFRRGFYGRVFAVLLPLSYLLITLVGWTWQAWPVFAQLEGQRLMPLLRPATIFLAALAAHDLFRLLLRLLRLRGATLLAGAATTAVALVLLLHPAVPLSENHRGLPLLQNTDQPAFTAIARSALLLNFQAQPADKPLILGNNMISWHDSFWIPALTDRNVFHNDWLWFWRTTDYGSEELMSDPFAALDAAFLNRHGLTLVLIDTTWGDLRNRANSLPYLTLLDPGTPGGYASYHVSSPPGPPNSYVIPEQGVVTSLVVTPERLRATVTSDHAQTVRLIVNDFPRWQVTLNGQHAPLSRTHDGYMAVAVPAGATEIDLHYTTSRANWLGRILTTSGLLLLLALLAAPPLARRWRHRR